MDKLVSTVFPPVEEFGMLVEPMGVVLNPDAIPRSIRRLNHVMELLADTLYHAVQDPLADPGVAGVMRAMTSTRSAMLEDDPRTLWMMTVHTQMAPAIEVCRKRLGDAFTSNHIYRAWLGELESAKLSYVLTGYRHATITTTQASHVNEEDSRG